MEFKRTISIKWNTEGLELSEDHKDLLKEEGFNRAEFMIPEGYREGELNELLTLEDDTELEVRGWWTVKNE